MSKPKNFNHLYTVASFGQYPVQIHCGVFGCGKSYSTAQALGIICKLLKEDCGLTGLTFVVAGRTQKVVMGTIGGELANLFGDDYVISKSIKDGKRKDAILFGQNIIYIGNSTVNSEASWRGISNIVGILCDEITLISEDQYRFMLGRLRGNFEDIKKAIDKLPAGHILRSLQLGFLVGSCNPDNPKHWTKTLIDSGNCQFLNWTMNDACWSGADAYYDKLMKQYPPGSLHYRRYLLGEWTGAEGMVFSSFDKLNNILSLSEYDIDYSAFDRMVLGVDYGSNHPTAIVLVGVDDSTNTYIVVDEWKLKGTAPSEIVFRIKRIIDDVDSQGGEIKHIFIDPSAVAIKDELTKNRISYIHANNRHLDGIGCINSKLYNKQLYIMDNCEGLINEIYGYVYKDNNTGKDEVVKVDDDLCDAMRYAVYTDNSMYGNGI